MTECPYPAPLATFETGVTPQPSRIVPLIEEGIPALEKINAGWAWDSTPGTSSTITTFRQGPQAEPDGRRVLRSLPVEQRAFAPLVLPGKLIVDGLKIPETLMRIVKAPLAANPANSVIAFRTTRARSRGTGSARSHRAPGPASRFKETDVKYHLIFTAETHNFPSGVAPFPGAETGTGGRIRDVQATGRGGLVVAGTAAYCVGNLQIPGYRLPWEDPAFEYPDNLASPLRIEIEASNGASDYGNKFGEPVIQGFTRSLGLRLPDGERREWLKPIMFTGGIGQMDARHVEKGTPEKGMLVTKIGGPRTGSASGAGPPRA